MWEQRPICGWVMSVSSCCYCLGVQRGPNMWAVVPLAFLASQEWMWLRSVFLEWVEIVLKLSHYVQSFLRSLGIIFVNSAMIPSGSGYAVPRGFSSGIGSQIECPFIFTRYQLMASHNSSYRLCSHQQCGWAPFIRISMVSELCIFCPIKFLRETEP